MDIYFTNFVGIYYKIQDGSELKELYNRITSDNLDFIKFKSFIFDIQKVSQLF